MVSNRIVQKNSGVVSNRLWGWGLNGFIIDSTGGSTTQFSNPIQVNTPTKPIFSGMSLGYSHACGIDTLGSLWCWGGNSVGQIGDGTTTTATNPVQISGTWKKVSCGTDFTMAIKDNDKMYAWGNNARGQLCQNNTTNRSNPNVIYNNIYWKDVSCGDAHVLAIDISDKLYSWGENSDGQLGINSTTSQSTAQYVSSNVIKIAAGYQHSLALKGSVYGFYSWGAGSYGQLGNGLTSSYSTPQQVTFINSIIPYVFAGGHNSGIIYADKAYLFGSNARYQIGDGTTTDAVSPTSPTGLLTPTKEIAFSKIGKGPTQVASFVNVNEKIYSCGRGYFGLKGDGTTTDSSQFQQITAYTDWKKLSQGGGQTDRMLAIRY